MRFLGVAILTVLASGCSDAFTARVDAVARAGEYELGVDRLAGILGTGVEVPVRRDVVEGLALLWVDYTLFAHSIVTGDSLLDTSTVLIAKWADVQQEIASSYHDMLMGEARNIDSAALDSTYSAGEYRLIKHILFMADAQTAENIRDTKQRVAVNTHMRLLGGLPWEEAVQLTDEPGGAERDGSLGVIGRGIMVPAFENVAYQLEPGEISDVTETQFGFHIVYRPKLSEVLSEFKDGIGQHIEQAFDEVYLRDLPEEWDIDVKAAAVPAVRQVANDPVRASASSKVIGTYRGGQFRVSDFARWIQGMPQQVSDQLPAATDEQIEELVGSLIRNEVLVREAREAGVTLDPETVARLQDDLRRELALMGHLIGFSRDSLPGILQLPLEQRGDLVEVRVLKYLEALMRNGLRFQRVPPYLATELRERTPWQVIPAGVERTLERARQIRVSIDSTLPQGGAGPGPLPGTVPPAPPVGADTSAGGQ